MVQISADIPASLKAALEEKAARDSGGVSSIITAALAHYDSRDTLLSTDKATAVTLDPIGDGKIRVRTSSWDQEQSSWPIRCSKRSPWANHCAWCAQRGRWSYEPTRLPTPTAGRRVDFKPLSHCNIYGVTRCVTM